jgi:transcriptional regulator with GAF, ATPase, and Fis domain
MFIGLKPHWPLAFWAMVIVVFTFSCGLLIVKFLIDPMKRFVVQARNLGVVKSIATKKNAPLPGDEIESFTRLFDQVTELLGKVEARELFPDIIGQSRAMRGVFNQIIKVAPTDSTIMILGETGTGKELIAHAIQQHSKRQGKPFVAINCAAIPAGLLESELFGHEKGAFTGATSRKPGKFELAHGGTVFMDEIGDMPLETQAKVLRAIEEGQIERVGGVKPLTIDIRLIAATNKDLSYMTSSQRFRQDLFFRLNVFTIYLPPLRERREDIPLLCEKSLSDLGTSVTEVSSEAMQLLMAYNWPGNVRELKNAVESASVLAETVIEPAHLPISLSKNKLMSNSLTMANASMDFFADRNLDEFIKEQEKGFIIEALSRAQGVQVNAARMLGIKERSLWHRLKKYDIDATKFKS